LTCRSLINLKEKEEPKITPNKPGAPGAAGAAKK
jgi:hypothetical protein